MPPFEPGVNLGHALARLNEALQSTGPTAAKKAQQWRQVLAGAWEGLLRLGDRQAVEGVPTWVTLEVAQGGFATGQFSAGGPLQAHEIAQLQALGLPQDPSARLALNLHFLGEAGQAELLARLKARHYRAQQPEELALLVVAWLRQAGQAAAAEALVAELSPFFDRLRFYPQPAEGPPPEGHSLHLRSVGELKAQLQSPLAPGRVEAAHESLRLWQPLMADFVALALKAWHGEAPRYATEAGGALRLDAKHQPTILGGWPQADPPRPEWRAEARALLARHEALRAEHRLNPRPANPKGALFQLRALVAAWAEGEGLPPREAWQLRRLLASHAHRRGLPGSAQTQAREAAAQAVLAQAPLGAWRALMLGRLEGLDPEGGLPDLAPFQGPVGAEEAQAHGLKAGQALHRSLPPKLLRAWSAPPEALAEAGLIGSLDQLAGLLPKLVAQAPAFGEPALQGLHEALHQAFSRRRSLLLLHLQHQVRPDELPWLKALKPWRLDAEGPSAEAKALLRRLVRLALAAFPHQPWPNPFLSQLRPLIQAAKLDWPLTEALAADIFMGEFSPKFAQAAAATGRQLAGSPYARHYGLPCAELAALGKAPSPQAPRAKAQANQAKAKAQAQAFLALCVRLNRGEGPEWGNPKANQGVLEWAQILTGHNLSAATEALGLQADLARDAGPWVRRVWRELVRLAEAPQAEAWLAFERHRARAFAFRQALFLIGWLPEAEQAQLLEELAEAIAQAKPEAQARLHPLHAALGWVLAGGELPAPQGPKQVLAWRRLSAPGR